MENFSRGLYEERRAGWGWPLLAACPFPAGPPSSSKPAACANSPRPGVLEPSQPPPGPQPARPTVPRPPALA